MKQLKIDNLTVGYKDKNIIENLSLEFEVNKITALVGPNGCGKSTLLKSIARLLRMRSGQITLDDMNIWETKPQVIAKHLSLLPQHSIVPEGVSVRELVGYGRSPYLSLWGVLGKEDKEIVAQSMELTQVTEFADRMVEDLSGGQQQRVFLAMALAQDTDYLLLDEPTTYLDLNHQTELMEIMRSQQKRGKTVIVVLHDLNQACRYCDTLVALKNGKMIVQGCPDEVMCSEFLEEVFSLYGEVHLDPVSSTPMFFAK